MGNRGVPVGCLEASLHIEKWRANGGAIILVPLWLRFQERARLQTALEVAIRIWKWLERMDLMDIDTSQTG